MLWCKDLLVYWSARIYSTVTQPSLDCFIGYPLSSSWSSILKCLINLFGSCKMVVKSVNPYEIVLSWHCYLRAATMWSVLYMTCLSILIVQIPYCFWNHIGLSR